MAWRATLCLMLVVVSMRDATAEPVRVDYERRGQAWSCPEVGVLEDELTALLGENAALRGRRIEVTVAGDGHELWAQVRLIEGDRVVAERTLTGNGQCRPLIAAVALALAIALEPSAPPDTPAPAAGRPAAPPETAPGPGSPPGSTPAPAPPPTPAVSPGATSPVEYSTGIGLVAGVGTAPGLSAGVTLEARARHRHLSLGVEYRHDRETSSPVGPGRFSTRLITASLVPCAHRRRLALCAVASTGVLRGQGHELSDARGESTPYFAYGARLAWTQPVLDRLSVQLDAELVGISGQTTIRVDDMEVWTTDLAAIGMGLSAVAEFP